MRAAASPPLLHVSSQWCVCAACPLPAISPDRKTNGASAGEKITFISHGKYAELGEKLSGEVGTGGAGTAEEGSALVGWGAAGRGLGKS